MRLDKFVCKSTLLSKQQACIEIEAGKVTVNDKIILDIAHQVHENNNVVFEQQRLISRPFRYLMMNKPTNTICSNIDEVYPSVLNLLNNAKYDESINNIDELHIAGRLDADTTGLILITDDGRWTYNITLPTNRCPKVYRVGLSKTFNPMLVDIFKQGIQLQGEQQLTKPAKVKIVDEKEVLLTITEGKFHQVKRMFAAVGNRVVRLHREQIGQIKLDIESEKWRFLTPLEINSVIRE